MFNLPHLIYLLATGLLITREIEKYKLKKKKIY